tara:strand:+ start:894 stop:1085 length:192 start_codon:yes stop_codon:yes gene_type:complete
MIIESFVGLVLNVVMAGNATGQNITRGALMLYKIDNKQITKGGVKEELHQETKDFILEKGGLK